MKKTARIICTNGNEFWTTQKQFWQWTREGLIEVTGQYPLTGRFSGRRANLLARVRNVIVHSNSVEYDHYQPKRSLPLDRKLESNPTKIAEYLFKLFLSEKEYECIIGDLTEEYYEIQSKSGVVRARLWIYGQVLRSIVPLVQRVFEQLSDRIHRFIR